MDHTQNSSIQPGYLIAVEGLDRSGKSTQIERLKGWLEKNCQAEGKITKVIRFPSMFQLYVVLTI